MSRKSFLQSSKRGSILALMVIVIVLLSVMGMSMLRCGLQARVYAARTSNEIAARAAADAGLIRAVWELNQNVQAIYSANDMPRQTDQLLANSGATFSYELTVPSGSTIDLTDVGGSKEEEDDPFNVTLPYTSRYVIKSVGKSGNAEKVLYATVRLKGLFESALLSKGKILLAPNTLITGYNSADPTDTDIVVKIGTLSIGDDQISLSPGTVVEGDVYVGVGGDPAEVIGAGGTITGQSFALTEPAQFPVITVPALPAFGTDISAPGGIPFPMTPADNGTYKDITLGNSDVLEITGGDVVLRLTGDIDLGNGAEIIVTDGSSLVLYIDGDISADNSAGFVNENSPLSALKIFATGDGDQSFELKAKSETFGVVYAPNADVELYPGADLHGAIVGKSISIKSGGTFKHDKALKDVNPDDEGVRFVVERWWE